MESEIVHPDIMYDIFALYTPILFAFGVLVLLVAWMPIVLRRLPLSLPILCVVIGMAIFTFTPFDVYSPNPLKTPILVEKATELIVIISLMGAGLKISRPLGWRRWNMTWRLLVIAMPLTIIGIAVTGHLLFGFGIATSLLLGACLAPTDPVLASDVQIISKANEEDETRFALTSEAGLNDALAFPFVHLAILGSVAGFGMAELADWAIKDVVLRLTVGLIAGWVAGWLLGRILYSLPSDTRLSRSGDGFVALGATLITYTVTEALYGYGFLAVFVAGLQIRRASDGHEFNTRMHDFADEAERLLMMVMLVFFGGMLVSGELLYRVGWREAIFVVIVLFLVRPVTGSLSLIGVGRPMLERNIVAFFGIRGLGSIFYLAYALNHGEFTDVSDLWRLLSLVIATSILIHGVTVTPLMRKLEK
ncbi:cation:proton antiporter [Candidatus Nitrotoga sp. M5]|uniref:cation:proton antiporter n=1 Tax=Candidatus Nitrotoga sp. M5 TaxID=2890409 RepID=UPI001EF31D49|nr:cation:proton antiporter [Candidatus Nitrotoga sp. M5]CAH1386943.1 Sodium/proton antiporter (CPA1 family) [Candidatus Nitrotoga sp. M5]